MVVLKHVSHWMTYSDGTEESTMINNEGILTVLDRCWSLLQQLYLLDIPLMDDNTEISNQLLDGIRWWSRRINNEGILKVLDHCWSLLQQLYPLDTPLMGDNIETSNQLLDGTADFFFNSYIFCILHWIINDLILCFLLQSLIINKLISCHHHKLYKNLWGKVGRQR